MIGGRKKRARTTTAAQWITGNMNRIRKNRKQANRSTYRVQT
jgi:hypothetical protein